MLLIIVLAGVAGVVWLNVLGATEPETPGCPPPVAVPGAPPPTGVKLAPTALNGVAPAPPQLTRVQVLNGNGERGEAGVVAEGLGELGFLPAAEPANDPLHPQFDLTCHAQIRFGEIGAPAARTLSLVVPCAELVRDQRPDDVVDLALGTEFTEVAPSEDARTVLTGLVGLGQPPPPPDEESQGGQAAGPVQPAIDPALLASARDVDCGPLP